MYFFRKITLLVILLFGCHFMGMSQDALDEEYLNEHFQNNKVSALVTHLSENQVSIDTCFILTENVKVKSIVLVSEDYEFYIRFRIGIEIPDKDFYENLKANCLTSEYIMDALIQEIKVTPSES